VPSFGWSGFGWPGYGLGWSSYGFGASSYWGSPFYDGYYDPYGPGRDVVERDGEGIQGDNIEVRVSPSNTSVYVNDLLYSNKGRARFSLPEGRWRVDLRAPGYLPETLELQVEQGVRYTIERKLRKDPTRDKNGQPKKAEELPEPANP
jgi:hypothetical protein